MASPRDLVEERKIFPEVIDRVNRNKARSLNYLLDPIGFKDVLPGGGRPQALINKDVEECDVFVLIFWQNWGSPSGKFSSGTEEELAIADRRFRKNKTPHLLIYFRDPPPEKLAKPDRELRRVRKLRARIEEENLYLYKPYSQPSEWRNELEEHLSRWLDIHHEHKQSGSVAAANMIVSQPHVSSDPAGAEDPRVQLHRLLELQKKLEAKVAKLETERNKLRAEAVGIAVEAMKLLEKGQLTLAEEKFTKSLFLYEEPEVINNFGYFLWQVGSPDRAKEMFERVLNLQSEDKKEIHDAIAYNRLGNVYMTKGDWKKAKQLYQKALAINTKLKRREGVADVYVSLGNISLQQEHLKAAEKSYQKALAINLKLGRQEGIADVYLSLGNIDRRRNQLSKAEEMYEAALAINLELKREERTADCYTNLGIVYRHRKELVKAEKMHRKALKINIALGLMENISDDYAGLGNVYITRKKTKENLAKAEKMYQKALAINTGLGRKEGIALAYNNLGEVYAVRKETKRATQAWARAAELFKDLGNLETARKITTRIRARTNRSLGRYSSRRVPKTTKQKRGTR